MNVQEENADENEVADFDDLVNKVHSLLGSYNNKQVDDYNKLVNICEELQQTISDYEFKIKQYEDTISNYKTKLGKQDNSNQKELSRTKECLARARESSKKYQKLYDGLVAKDFEKQFYALQRKYQQLELTAKKYNVTCQDEYGRNDHYVMHFYDEDTDEKNNVYCIIDSIYQRALSYHDDERHGYPLDERRPMDVEIVITYSTGICLQVIFSKFGNFIIPSFSDGKPYGITEEIIRAVESRRDQFLKLLPTNLLIKRIKLLKHIPTSSVYTEEECKLLSDNKSSNMYDVTNYFGNMDTTLLNGVSKDTQKAIIQKAIDYLKTREFE